MTNIPPEVLEAGARAIQSVMLGPIMDAPSQAAARAACLAMIEAWPGMRQRPYWDLMTNTRYTEIILPEA